jgi:hypothetical protein
MSWWDDVKFVVTGEQTSAVKAAPQAIGQTAMGAALGNGGFAAGSALAAAANDVGSSGGSAGVISMNRDEMEDTLKRAENLRNDINGQIDPASFLTRMQAPAEDRASKGATSSANNAGKYYVGHLQRQQAYLNTVIAKMREALGLTVRADQDSADTVNEVGRGIAG